MFTLFIYSQGVIINILVYCGVISTIFDISDKDKIKIISSKLQVSAFLYWDNFAFHIYNISNKLIWKIEKVKYVGCLLPLVLLKCVGFVALYFIQDMTKLE